MSSKTKVYNLALSALLLSREVSNADTDKSNEVKVLNNFYEIAFHHTLEDLDLDSTSQPITLELLATLTEDPWKYAYKYPSNCVFLRRLVSGCVTDNRSTHISKRVGIYEGQKVIFTNEYQAVAECIPKDLDLSILNPMGLLSVAQKLAYLSAPLITGKGAKTLRKSIKDMYDYYVSEAQEADALENFNYEPEYMRSEFVEARMS